MMATRPRSSRPLGISNACWILFGLIIQWLGVIRMGLPWSMDLTNLTGWNPLWGPAPRFGTPRSEGRPSFGAAVGRVADAMGHPLYPGQRFVFDVALELVEGFDWAYEEVNDFEPRRGGKTYKLVPLVAHRCSQSKPAQAWLTAQDNTRAVNRWLDVAGPLERELNRTKTVVKKKISHTHEIVTWIRTGSFFKPFAPTPDAMHGEDPDLAIADELWSFDLADKAYLETAIEPAFAVKSGQFWKLSAAGTEDSAWMNLEIERGRRSVAAGIDRGLAYFEWSIPETIDGKPVDELDEPDLVELILRFHPRGYANGVDGETRGLRAEFVAGQIAKNPSAAIRNYGNLPQENRETGLWPLDAWQLATWRQNGPRIPDGARIALGIAVDELGRESSIVIGAENGPIVLEAPTELTRPGETWVAAEVVRLTALYDVGAVGVCYFGRVRSVADQVAQLVPDVHMIRLNGPDFAAACARFESEIIEATPTRPSLIQHGSERHLTAAMQAAAKNTRSKAGPMWSIGETREPIQALEAATIAAWAVDHMPEPAAVAAPFSIF